MPGRLELGEQRPVSGTAEDLVQYGIRALSRRAPVEPARQRSLALAPASGALLFQPLILAAQGGSAAPGADAAEPFVHDSWTVQDGLPVNSITGILQSRDGYIWIATFDGLARFDGVRFTVFNSSNSEGLPSNRIIGLVETSDGSLWLRTEQWQLVRFHNGEFAHFGPERGLADGVASLHEARGTLWVGTQRGLGLIEGERFVPVAAETIRAGVSEILEQSDGTIWAALHPAGLVRIEDGRVMPFAPETELASEEVMALYEDARGALWIGTDRSVWRYDGDALERVLTDEHVRGIRASPRTGEVWIVTQAGVFRIDAGGPVRVDDRTREGVRPWILIPDRDGSMLYAVGAELHREGRRLYALGPEGASVGGPALVSAATLDHEGSLWLGTFAGGLHRLKPSLFTVYGEAEGLAHRNVYSVYEDRSGAVWIGTFGGGASRLTGTGISNFPPRDGYPPYVNSFLHDRAGLLWLGTGDGIRVCALPAMRCARPGSDPIEEMDVSAVYEDASGTIWVGTQGGVFRQESGVWRHLLEADGAPSHTVRVFRQTADGALWMGTNGGGLTRYSEGRFTHVTVADGLPSDLIRSLYQDADGWLWIGTEGRGLARLDPGDWGEGRRGAPVVTYRMRDGLYDGVVHQILEDDYGRLWMSTNRGIFWVWRSELNAFADGRVQTINSTAYTERDGLRNREANGGVHPAGVRTRDGRLWFPTQDGVVVVDPARIQGNRVPPNVVIERVIAAGIGSRPGAAPLELGVAQRDLEIEYTALSFLAPGNVRFRYRLDPYDAGWVEAGSRRTAYYTQVPPGRYTFRLMASNNDGVWNEQGAILELRLVPRFRETSAFRLLSLLALTLALAAGFGWRVRSLRSRARELGRQVDERTGELRARERQLAAQNAQLETLAGKLQELDRAKSRFFANVSHEFRTPLTLTIGPLEDLRARLGEGSNGEARHLDLALRNARRLLRLVNQILDVAKLESGQMKLRARLLDVVGFARGVGAAFASTAEQRRIAFEVVAPREEILAWFDPDALEKVLSNLLSNAFKFTPGGGRIEVDVQTDPLTPPSGAVLLRVRDSGPGIAPEHLPHVFERFYQVDESTTRAHPGTGIGLSLTRELVELHGGRIAVENVAASAYPRGGAGTADPEATGAIFTVVLRLGREHLRDDQIADGGEREPAEGKDPWGPAGLPYMTGVAGASPGADHAHGDGADVRTLLIADDSADLRAYVRSHFDPRYRIIEAADGVEAIERARRLVPDLVVSDVMMPGADGYEVCRTLKSSADTDFIPVILLTARASTEERIAGLAGGADDYLAKPFEMRELEARVDNLIASRRLLRERFASDRVELRASADAGELSPGDRAFVERVRAAIEARLDDPDFGVAELAQAVFQDRSHLFRRTRELFEEAPSDLIRRLRLERAERLLTEQAGSVADVAYGVGFNSVSYFCRCFREAYGQSPAAYRAGRSA